MLETQITAVCAAVDTIHDAGWIQEKNIIDLGKQVTPLTKLFRECAKADVTQAKPFQTADVYDDNPESLHNLEVMMKKILKVKGKGKAVIESEIWTAAMIKHFKDPIVQNVCLSLAKPSDTIFKELKLIQGTDLNKIAITTIWKGAQQLLGTIEEITKPIAKIQQKGTSPKFDKKASKDQNVTQENPESNLPRKPRVQVSPVTNYS
jgi:hypothetical protein